MHATQPIGIFDSGVGGLTVAKEIKRLLPHENIIYFGDTKHLPYGDKSKETIVGYSVKIAQFLLDMNCKAIVIACNTATGNALKEIKDVVGHQAFLFDVISPVAEKVAYGLNQSVGVIATKATVNSGVYKKSIHKHNQSIKVHQLATPLLVPIIEEGLSKHPISKLVIEHYLLNSKLKNIDSLILGCTHYPLLVNEVKQFYQNKVQIIDSPKLVAHHVKAILESKNKLNSEKNQAYYHFYLSDLSKNFQKTTKKFFGNKISLEWKVL